ncbi:MAG: EAL domain-containing protein [Woeseiaceae bacterium]|nr:EAL domain-containing protein [Woeseiaceae bacterium]NIP20511.1 EAL domain-containing protein [Woeseiaceae bacterium]NIS89106.1 EAL domain-containing protein [Woeseiaceae bacterium]
MSADLHNLQTIKNIGKAKGLLHSLVPRAHCFCFYDRKRDCVWSSDGADDYEIDNFITDLPDEIIADAEKSEGHIRRTLNSGRTLLVLSVRSDDDSRLGLLVSVFSRNAGKSSSFNPQMLAKILRPAVDLIGESLITGRQLELAEQRGEDAEKELTLVYEVDEKIHGMSRSHAGLAQLVGQSGRYLGIAYSVLLIPGKRIRVSATHSSWKKVNRKVLDRYLVDHLMPKLEGKRWPAVFEIPGIEGEEDPPAQGFQTLLSPLIDKHGNLEGVLAQLGRVNGGDFTKAERRFMAHIVRKVEYVIEQSFDAMTGLMNRAGFEAQLQESAKDFEKPDDAHQLIYFDLDNLQLVNDTFGREAGDAVIIRFARMLEEDLSRKAVVSRLTGDDFCILLTHADTDAALELAQTIRDKGDALRYLEGDKSLQITMSIGLAEFNSKEGARGRALTTARLACESAKEHGRDRIEVYDEKNLSIVQRHDDMQLVAQIQQALDEDGFELLAQPIVDLKKDEARPQYEVLLRMNDGDGAAVSTKALFSAAERYKLMPQIDRWVVSSTLAQIAEYQEVLANHEAIFSINLSGQSLSDDDILEFIDEELNENGVSPRTLCFEITESAAVSNLAKAQRFIDELRTRGCSISLDDFGAGLSSFAYLKNFKVDALKIDGSFIRDIIDNRISESMVAAITQVAKVMELKTVAEYVESEETRRLIGELGVDYAQGHIIGKPIPLIETLTALTEAEKKSTG